MAVTGYSALSAALPVGLGYDWKSRGASHRAWRASLVWAELVCASPWTPAGSELATAFSNEERCKLR
jgi:hypothetical protein